MLRGRRSRWIGLGAGLLAALVVIVIEAGTPTDRSPDRPGASGSASVPPVAGGPLVYYEILDAEGSRLMERRLDGPTSTTAGPGASTRPERPRSR
jgi:hypothetical protein